MQSSTVGVLCAVDYTTPPRYMYFRMDNAGGVKTPEVRTLPFTVSQSPGGLLVTPQILEMNFVVAGGAGGTGMVGNQPMPFTVFGSTPNGS